MEGHARMTPTPPWANAPSFIETQFPVAKLSLESYKERTAKQGQTLTGLGKWWGRKPLVLVRAALLGLLLPTTDDPLRDREIFLKLMSMDAAGLRLRKSKGIAGPRLVAELQLMSPGLRRRYLDEKGDLRRLSGEERAELQNLVFDRLPYGEKLQFCDRPEQIDGPDATAWADINAHLGTKAHSLSELVEQLGARRFGRRPRVGDAFCGGGSIPFEAARLGCDVYASDLNPVAALLTWAALHIVGGGQDVVDEVEEAQRAVYDAVDRQITAWGIEHNSQGWRADAYLYCVEVVDPETGWRVPLAPSWVIGKKTKTIAKLVPDPANKRYDIEIHEGVSDAEMVAAETGTVANNRVVHPMGNNPVPMEVIRRDLRMWDARDVVPRPDDVFQERLYCIRWVETFADRTGRDRTKRHYRAPTAADLEREATVLRLLRERFDDWQARGHLPSRPIEPGDKTDEPIRTRGWTYWHHLFTPRQLLVHGMLSAEIAHHLRATSEAIGILLNVGRCADWNSKLCRWNSDAANEKTEQTFSNQALNTLYNHGNRTLLSLETTWFPKISVAPVPRAGTVQTRDARSVNTVSEYWITDPPYADAINYEEISEHFLAWYEKWIATIFPRWDADTRRALAVKGTDQGFRQAMVASYTKLTQNTPADGKQVVMFTHQDASIWADLTLILWAAGLAVTAAWCIQTEREATGIRQGNYVQGTVLMVLRKRVNADAVFLDEITHTVETEVRRQLDSMTQLDDESDPNFGDADYQLAAYAAALRVLTAQPIVEIDPAREIQRVRPRGEIGPVEQLIRDAVRIACDHLVPRGFDAELWKTLAPAERFYIKGVEVESHGEYRSGVYQELARGFGVADYDDLLATSRANETRLKTATEFGRRQLSGDGFAGSLLRQALFAVHQTVRADDARAGLNYLKTELEKDYWNQRAKLADLLTYFGRLAHVTGLDHWQADATAAALLSGAVQNDHL
jgi:adenine-specific DNA methylase